MALNEAARIQNIITGKVVVKETGVGIPDLVVVIYDLDPNTRPEEEFYTMPATVGTIAMSNPVVRPSLGDRLGSVLTTANGSFALPYTDPEFRRQTPNEQRPDLLLMVQAPEDADSPGEVSMLFTSKTLRQNSGKLESYFIRIPSKALTEAGIVIPSSDAGKAQSKIESYIANKTALRDFDNGVAAFNKTVVEGHLNEKKDFSDRLKKSLAADNDIQRDKINGVFLKENDTVKTKVNEVINSGIGTANKLIDGANKGVPVNLYLNEKDRNDLKTYFQNATGGYATIPESEIRPILFRATSTENLGTLIVNSNPIEAYNREKSSEEVATNKLLADAAPVTPVPPSTNGTATIPTPISDQDIKIQLAKMLLNMPVPDRVLDPKVLPSRPTKDTIEEGLGNFALKKGPADVAAFYDFHSLQIAFEHVWQQLFDEDLINGAFTLNQKIQQQTGSNPSSGGKVSISNLKAHLNTALTHFIFQVPANVAAHFDITKEEWNDLEKIYQDKLTQIADSLNNSLTVTVNSGGSWGPSVISIDALSKEKYYQKLKEQGERIIDSVRHDNYYTMHKTLRDLHQRLNAGYEYTVFAADNNDYSVNFGILNTFRQQWLPLNYQVGKLCKTIPLAPKEERKYSLKITRHLKRTEKDARKNNSSVTGEQSSTQRVEADIVAKAQNKTTFNQSGDFSYNVGVYSVDAKTSFGVDAQNESAQTRKDFRDSILKATQEYKEERSAEISTEDSSDYESNDSGTIMNPNDELAVTYLFYELQRRYRVSEQLYRVMPVVLVAQPVPKPHEITESWVIAHDWILNKFLLDESFRPALAYLANKSVGDDFALRELRRNLREQRNLVETLKIQFATASLDAENKYRALLSKVNARIDSESDANNEGFFTNVAGFFGYNDADPETAKARELAATDEHRYAIEKAEKIAASLKQEINTLHGLTNDYNKTLRDHLDNETRTARLLVHFRNNIIYYMQAIWSLEPPDQRMLRLQKVQVPDLKLDGELSFKVKVDTSKDPYAMFRGEDVEKHQATMSGKLQTPFTFRPLLDVANIDQPLGFKGNYIIFPMKQHNALTEFMAAPYIDSAFGAMDPDQLGNLNLDEYAKYVETLHANTQPDKFEDMKPALRDWLEQLLADPLRNGDEVIIPSGSLYIEVLPSAHPLLEDFKLRHRELDVYKVQEEVRKLGLENLRYAARLIHDERNDPDIEKVINVEGTPGIDINDN